MIETEEQYLKRMTQKAVEKKVKAIFDELDKALTKEMYRLKKYDDRNWKLGHKEDGRKSTASILTLGINVRNLINKIKKKYLKEGKEDGY